MSRGLLLHFFSRKRDYLLIIVNATNEAILFLMIRQNKYRISADMSQKLEEN